MTDCEKWIDRLNRVLKKMEREGEKGDREKKSMEGYMNKLGGKGMVCIL